jgi:hypothetical protein
LSPSNPLATTVNGHSTFSVLVVNVESLVLILNFSLQPVKKLRSIQILGNIWLISVVATPMLILGTMAEGVPTTDSRFVTGVNNNPALLPTKEHRDSIAYLVTLILIIATVAFLVHMSRTKLYKIVWFSPAAVIVVFVALANAFFLDSRLRPINPGIYFEGLSVADLSFGLIVILGVTVAWRTKNQFPKLVLQGISIVISITCILSFIVLTTTNTDITNSQFVINEMLSATAGLNPMFSFSSQYSSGLPYLAKIISLSTGGTPYSTAAILFSFLSLVITGGCLYVISKVISDLTARLFSFSLILSAIAYTNPNGGRITSYLQGFPIRTCVPVLLAVILCKINYTNKAKTELIAGVLGVLLILINFDFGIAAYFSLGSVILLQRFSAMRVQVALVLVSALRFITPLILGLTALRIAQISTPSSCNLICTGEFAYLVGGTGFLAVPELTFGIQHTVLSTAVIGLFVGLAEFIRVSRFQSEDAKRLLVCRLLLGLSIFCILSFPYFTNRSYAAMLVQFFLPWTAVLLLLVRLILSTDIYAFKHRKVCMGIVAILLLIPVSNLRHLPPIDDISNLVFDSPATTNFRLASEWIELPSIVDRTLLDMNVSRNQVGLISGNAMPDAISNHILPAIPYNSPASIVLKSQQRFSCDFLASTNLEVLIIRADSESVDLKYVLVCSGFKDYTIMSGYSIASR